MREGVRKREGERERALCANLTLLPRKIHSWTLLSCLSHYVAESFSLPTGQPASQTARPRAHRIGGKISLAYASDAFNTLGIYLHYPNQPVCVFELVVTFWLGQQEAPQFYSSLLPYSRPSAEILSTVQPCFSIRIYIWIYSRRLFIPLLSGKRRLEGCTCQNHLWNLI